MAWWDSAILAPEAMAEALLDVLRLLHQRLEGSSAVWALTGSLGMVLQGLPLEPHDIDLQTDPVGAYEIERRLAVQDVVVVDLVDPLEVVGGRRPNDHVRARRRRRR